MREVKVEGVDKKGWLFGWCVCSQRGIPEMLLPHLTVEFEDGTVKDYPLEKVTFMNPGEGPPGEQHGQKMVDLHYGHAQKVLRETMEENERLRAQLEMSDEN